MKQEQRPGRISIIVAMAKNGVIGVDNKLPWHLSADLKRFRALTMGHHIIMGRKTYESIGKPLPGRTSVVITANPAYRVEGVLIAGCLDDALAFGAADSEAFVIGGAQIYRQALPLADRIYLTEIEQEFEGDTRFPALPPGEWRESERLRGKDAATGLSYSFLTLERATRT